MNRALWRYGRSDNADPAGRGDALCAPADGRRRAGRGRPEGALGRQPARVRQASSATPSAGPGPTRCRSSCRPKLVAGRAAEATVEVLTAGGRRVPNVDVALTVTGGEARRDRQHGRERTRQGRGHGQQPRQRSPSRPAPRTSRRRLPTLYVPTSGAAKRQRPAPRHRVHHLADREGRGPGAGAARAEHPDQRPEHHARLVDHRHREGHRARRPDRDDPGRALRAVPVARSDQVRGSAGVDGHDHGHRRRRVRHRAGHARHARLLHVPRVDRGDRHDRAAPRPPARRSPRRRSCAARPRSRRRSARRRPRPARRSPTPWSSPGWASSARRSTSSSGAPFPTREAITCEGTPFWTGTLAVNGDGTYVDRAGRARRRRLLHLPRVDRRERGLPPRS